MEPAHAAVSLAIPNAFGVALRLSGLFRVSWAEEKRRSSAALQNIRLSRRSLVRRRMLSVQSVVKLFLLFFAEFLESGIAAQGVPERIEPKKGRRNGRGAVIIPAPIGRF